MSAKFTRLATLFGVAAAAILSANVSAAPIEFIYTGTGSGSIGGETFNSAPFTITEQSDTGGLLSCGGTCSYIDAISTSITIGGVGSFSFITGTRTFDAGGLVGLSRAGSGGLDLYDTFDAGAAYDMVSSIGPIFGAAQLLQWTSSDVDTSGGVLVFNSATTDGTFQAIAGSTPVPEPAGLALFGLAGLAGVIASRRRKVR